MISVVLVYKTGGDYTIDDVERLARAVRRNLTIPHKIYCMTDIWKDAQAMFGSGALDGVFTLQNNLPGWWSKMEVFRVHSRAVLYLDLDTVIVGNIDALAQWVLDSRPNKDLLMLRGFYRGDQCSGIMGWQGDLRWVWEHYMRMRKAPSTRFVYRPSAIVMQCKRITYRGDQEWLSAVLPKSTPRLDITLAQDVQPGIRSYKVHIKDDEQQALPAGTSIVCFHGKPRPKEVVPEPEWMKQHWSAV